MGAAIVIVTPAASIRSVLIGGPMARFIAMLASTGGPRTITGGGYFRFGVVANMESRRRLARASWQYQSWANRSLLPFEDRFPSTEEATRAVPPPLSWDPKSVLPCVVVSRLAHTGR